jgi:hypothetical protein
MNNDGIAVLCHKIEICSFLFVNIINY